MALLPNKNELTPALSFRRKETILTVLPRPAPAAALQRFAIHPDGLAFVLRANAVTRMFAQLDVSPAPAP